MGRNKIFEEEVEILTRTSQQHPQKVEEQLNDFELLFGEKNERAGSNFRVSRELANQFGGGQKGFESFLIELMKKSGLHYDREKGKYLQAEEAPTLSTFDLLRIAAAYEAPEVEFKPKSIRDKSVSLHAKFEEDPLRIVFNSLFNKTQPKAVCTKNKDAHSLASYQDAADPFTHHLQVRSESKRRKESEAEKTPPAMLEAIIIGTEKEDKSILLVEGVYGIVEDNLKEEAFSYLYSCLIQYAQSEKKSLLFNLSFNPGSQHLPLQFANYVGWRNAKTVFYEFAEGKSKPRKKREKFRGYSCEIKAVAFTDEAAEERRNNLEQKLNEVFVNPKQVIESFSKEKRYTDTWWQSCGKDEWNMREGNVYCLQIGLEGIETEGKKVSKFRKYWPPLRYTLALFSVIGGALGVGFWEKELPLDNRGEGKIGCIRHLRKNDAKLDCSDNGNDILCRERVDGKEKELDPMRKDMWEKMMYHDFISHLGAYDSFLLGPRVKVDFIDDGKPGRYDIRFNTSEKAIFCASLIKSIAPVGPRVANPQLYDEPLTRQIVSCPRKALLMHRTATQEIYGEFFSLGGMNLSQDDFSLTTEDSRMVAFEYNDTETKKNKIGLLNLLSKQIIWDTDGLNSNTLPTFLDEGKKLAWISETEGGSYDLIITSIDSVTRHGNPNLEKVIPLGRKKVFGLSVSPDNKYFAYCVQSAGTNPGLLNLLRVDGSEKIDLSMPCNHKRPQWSPDSTKLLIEMVAKNKRKLVPEIHLLNIAKKRWSKVIGGYLPRWSPDGKKMVYVSRGYDVFYWGFAGSGRGLLSDGLGQYSSPAWSFDGKQVMYIKDGTHGTSVVVKNYPDGKETPVSACYDFNSDMRDRGGPAANWGAFDHLFLSRRVFNCGGDGYLLGKKNQELFVQRIDFGEEVDEAANISSVSEDFSKLAYSSTKDGSREIYLLDVASGNSRRLTGTKDEAVMPRISDDGMKIAYYESNSRSVHSINLHGLESQVELESFTLDHEWDPNGEYLLLATMNSGGGASLYLKKFTSNTASRIADRNILGRGSFHWCPKGDRFLFGWGKDTRGGLDFEIHMYDLIQNTRTKLVNGFHASCSPDDDKVAFLDGKTVAWDDEYKYYFSDIEGNNKKMFAKLKYAKCLEWSLSGEEIIIGPCRDSLAEKVHVYDLKSEELQTIQLCDMGTDK